MESYEVEIGGTTFPVKAVRDLSGHDIKQYRIHGGKSIPFVKNKDQTKMEEGEVFAIETFGTTGRGYLVDGVCLPPVLLAPREGTDLFQPGVYGYGRDPLAPKRIVSPLATARSLNKTINDNFGSLVFCRRYLDRLGIPIGRYLAGVSIHLIRSGLVLIMCR